MMKRLTTGFLLLLWISLCAPVALADQPGVKPPTGASTDGAGRNADQMVAVTQDQEEKVSGLTMMILAYIAVWVILMGYVLFLLSKQRNITDELGALRSRLEMIDETLTSRDDEDRS